MCYVIVLVLCGGCVTCNGYTSKCVEFFIFIVSILSFIIAILQFFFVKREYLTLLCYILQIVLIFSSFLILILISLIIIFRYKNTINNNRNKISLIFSIIGLILSIFSFICMIAEISFIHSHYQEINHPCLNLKKNDEYIKYIHNSSQISQVVNIQDFCAQNQNYNSHVISLKQFLIAYLLAAAIIICFVILVYSWFSEFRRINFIIDGYLNNFTISVEHNIDIENYDCKGKEERNEIELSNGTFNKEFKNKKQDIKKNNNINNLKGRINYKKLEGSFMT